MKYTEALQKRAEGFIDGVSSAWKKHVEDPVNAYIKKNYTDPQTGNAYDNFKSRLFNDLGTYAPSILIGGGVAGLGAFGISEWINSRRKKDEQKLPTGILTMLASLGGGIGGAYLWDKYNKTASDLGELQPVADPSLMVTPEEQEALEDPSGKKKKKTEKPDNIQQMIYAQKAKQRRQAMKMASLTYSKVAALLKQADEYDWWTKPNQATEYAAFAKRGPTDPTKQQEAEAWRMAWNNPGVAFTWDDDSRKYIPTQYDKKLKTNVPYKGNINKQAPATPSSNTQVQGIPPKTNFTTPKPVTPVQPPQYRQADTTVQDVEGFR